MAEKKTQEMVLTCDVCGEPLHARVVSTQKRNGKAFRLLTKPELFCAECDKPFNFISHFKKQYAKKKQSERVAL